MLKEEISQTVKFLIDHGADVNAKTAQGFTALIYASRDGFLKTVEHLITNGADIDDQTSFGYTALMVKSKFYKKRGATFFYDVTRKLGPLDFTQYRSKSSSF